MKEENLFGIFIEELEELIKKAKSIITKIEEKPNDDNLTKQIRIIFHTIKGNSGFIGLQNLYQFCYLLESIITDYVIINPSIILIFQESINILEKYILNLNGNEFSDLDLSFINDLKNNINQL